MTLYLYQQLTSVYGQSGHCDDILSGFFASKFGTKEEVVDDKLSCILEGVDEEDCEEAVLDRGGMYEGDYQGYDGYARTYEHIDGIKLIGEISPEDLDVLANYGILS